MKRIITLSLVFIILVSLAACTSNDKSKIDPNKTTNEITFKRASIVDNDKCSIRILRIDPNPSHINNEMALKVAYQNKTEDTSYYFSLQAVSVNGVNIKPASGETVPAGETVKADISIFQNDIDLYSDIGLTFQMKPTDSGDSETIIFDTAHIYPYGEEKANKFTRQAQKEDILLLDTPEVKLIKTDVVSDENWTYINMYIENKTDHIISIKSTSSSIYSGTVIEPGNSAFGSFTFPTDDIKDIQEGELEILVYDLGISEWTYGDLLVNETVKLTF